MTGLLAKICTLALVVGLVTTDTGAGTPPPMDAGAWVETRFQTGCDPGPFSPPLPPEHLETNYPPLGTAANTGTLSVDLGDPSAPLAPNDRPIMGTGFNLENGLWSCPEFRGLFRSEILDPFRPAIARIDSGLLPAAPPEVPAAQLEPGMYASVLDSAPYANSWAFFRRLNRAGVKIILGVWGGPPQFTDDGTRLGVLLPQHYDDYVDYVAAVVDYLVNRQHIDIWATTIANEPDGGDGNQIPPEGLAYIAHQLAPRLAVDNVKLYGPDTSNGTNALVYLRPLLDDPVVADDLAFVAFHQYYPSAEVQGVLDFVESRRPEIPVVVTEYTSFSFGDLDAGQEANAQYGFGLDIVATLLSHYRQGVDAALYWDAVDYLQPGHEAITKWGLLQGPAQDFKRRVRYYSLLQVLPYLQPGARVLDDSQTGDDQLTSLAIRTAAGLPALFMVNQDFVPIDLTLTLNGTDVAKYPQFVVTRTARGHLAEVLGRADLHNGEAQLTLPPRSITTLFPPGAEPSTTDDQ